MSGTSNMKGERWSLNPSHDLWLSFSFPPLPKGFSMGTPRVKKKKMKKRFIYYVPFPRKKKKRHIMYCVTLVELKLVDN